MTRFAALAARVSTPEEAVAASVGLRRREDPPALFDRAVLSLVEDPLGSARLAEGLVEAGDLDPVEVRWLLALHGGPLPEAPWEGALYAAARVRHVPEADLPGALHEARRICTGVLGAACLHRALAGRGLEQRTEGETTVLLDPARALVLLPGTTLDLGRAPRRFALLWALATAAGPLGREPLFGRVWRRPFHDEDDATALHATVSRTRSTLPKGLDVARLPGGAYTLDPAWAVHTWSDAPASGPLAPLGRDGEAAAARLALRETGRAVLHGAPGSGTSHLARSLAAAWPTGSIVVDLRAGPIETALPEALGVAPAGVARALGDRLLVLDHADAVEAVPAGPGPVLLARATPLTGLREVAVGPLVPREAASLAKALGAEDPGAPALPLDLRLGADPLQGLRPSARRLLARLLAVPGGAPTGLARRLGGLDVLATLDDLETLEARRLVNRCGDRLIAEDALRAQVEPEPLPEVVADWSERRRPAAPEALERRLAEARASSDLDRANVALRRLVAECRDLPRLWARALLALAEVADRSGRPDAGVEQDLVAAEAPTEWSRFGVRLALLLGVRDLWRGELARAREALARTAREASHLGARDLEETAWTELAEACLRRGLPEACARALEHGAEAGDRERTRRVAVAAGLALDLGRPAAAAAHLADAPAAPWCRLRQGQLAEVEGEDPRPHYEAAVEGFSRSDRRWLAVALALLARCSPDEASERLEQARAALSPEDTGSAAVVTLVDASLAGRARSAVRAVRLPGHADAATFPWDLVRFLCATPSPR